MSTQEPTSQYYLDAERKHEEQRKYRGLSIPERRIPRAERGGAGSLRRSSRVKSAKVRDWLRGALRRGQELEGRKPPRNKRNVAEQSEATLYVETSKRDEDTQRKKRRKRGWRGLERSSRYLHWRIGLSSSRRYYQYS